MLTFSLTYFCAEFTPLVTSSLVFTKILNVKLNAYLHLAVFSMEYSLISDGILFSGSLVRQITRGKIINRRFLVVHSTGACIVIFKGFRVLYCDNIHTSAPKTFKMTIQAPVVHSLVNEGW